ncbi:hypothetical protein IID62_11300 [candidate division KSB1 bacterium]|nr:hypothetical protein [candidate division KSB1 bacterium]
MKSVLLSATLVILITACSGDITTPGIPDTNLNFNFDVSENWNVGFSDYPMGFENFFELTYENTSLPINLGSEIPALMISGDNHSDDLFMFAKKKIGGLNPKTKYRVTFELEFATNASVECIGVGGSPGSSVYIKAGVTLIEPDKITGPQFYTMNIDKGNQASEGTDTINLGVFGHPGPCENDIYELKKVDNLTDTFEVVTDETGELWIMVGTDSGFEAITTIFYNSLTIRFEAVN